MTVDPAVLNLAVTIALLLATLAYRKRIAAAIGRLVLVSVRKWVAEEFFEVEEGTDDKGKPVVKVSLRPHAQVLAQSLVSMAIAQGLETVKGMKLKLPAGISLGEGSVDLSNLNVGDALAASGMFGRGKKGEAIGGVIGMVLNRVLGPSPGGAKAPPPVDRSTTEKGWWE